MAIEIEVQKRKIIIYDLDVKECNAIMQFLSRSRINRSYTVLDQHDKCVSMKSTK